MDFYLWRTVKDKVYGRKPCTLEELRQEITAARRSILQRKTSSNVNSPKLSIT
ncbi:hypothetical protein C0J52_19982 [Blattella germanica]|nr:hypothetical protein C0J52_19982 [Blattella germanica]